MALNLFAFPIPYCQRGQDGDDNNAEHPEVKPGAVSRRDRHRCLYEHLQCVIPPGIAGKAGKPAAQEKVFLAGSRHRNRGHCPGITPAVPGTAVRGGERDHILVDVNRRQLQRLSHHAADLGRYQSILTRPPLEEELLLAGNDRLSGRGIQLLLAAVINPIVIQGAEGAFRHDEILVL